MYGSAYTNMICPSSLHLYRPLSPPHASLVSPFFVNLFTHVSLLLCSVVENASQALGATSERMSPLCRTAAKSTAQQTRCEMIVITQLNTAHSESSRFDESPFKILSNVRVLFLTLRYIRKMCNTSEQYFNFSCARTHTHTHGSSFMI